eukprot:CAMPEP_0202344464 /NCGR_PEP_ID=MMETSP1126-20121109/4135_1 /ASSEMBLY_ACC=CAM_ASM_000457 /TAXON_ID=3047 /ORGANISM="Dunaliella tertiolecta, Strain CCMP1320" /LENGTH=289 /DNA_ID=CAMNT_0048935659 /DNA_START=60 /DNA_END=929 /DNA_ORIENTATION=-
MAQVSSAATMTSAGVRMPKLIYGTAWKKERSADLVYNALVTGFRGIDTACQPKHYREDLVGQGIARAMKDKSIKREDLFIQTKFTSLAGQDPAAIPYDRNAPLAEQVRQSFNRSLENLQTAYVDSLVLHSPMPTVSETMEIYRVFETFHASGSAKQLGISNIYSLDALAAIFKAASVKPAVVQNRFYQQTGYDKDIRRFCKDNNIRYQSFWSLTANPHLLASNALKSVAKRLNITPEQAMYKLLMSLGITPLDGTTNSEHMKEDLAVLSLPELTAQEVEAFSSLTGGMV